MAAAATVGLTPWSLTPNGGPSVRSLDELHWRKYMLKANLESDGYRWVKSQSYLNLDPTEKGAVSYFHGMAQAGFVLDEVFGLPYTAHIDTCLLVMGQTLKESRPDLLAVKGNGYAAAAVECKPFVRTYRLHRPSDTPPSCRAAPTNCPAFARRSDAECTVYGVLTLSRMLGSVCSSISN